MERGTRDQEHTGGEAGSACPALVTSCFNLALLLLWMLLQNNQHKLTLSMKPDDKYSEKQAQMETEKLQQKVSALSLEDKQQIYDKGQTLNFVPGRFLAFAQPW